MGALLAFASGATALIYEVLWMRRFIALFGATAPAASATLSAIFIGLGVGSAVFGSRCARFRRPLRVYGVLEIGIGLSAALVYPFAEGYGRLFPLLYSHLAPHLALFIAVKTALAVLALFLPAFLMGGTLALLAQAFVASPWDVGIGGSSLYAANTFGATAGTLCVPFLLLPYLGAPGSYFATVGASLLIGLIAWRLDRSLSPAERATEPVSGRKDRRMPRSAEVPGVGLAAMAFSSGLLTLALEVLWTRMLAQFHENSIYSLAIVLATFLVGLAGGAGLARVLLARNLNPKTILGWAWTGSGLLVFASPGLFYHLTRGLSYVTDFGDSPRWVTLLFAVLTMLAPTLLAGMILPVLLQLAPQAQADAPGAVVGKLLAQNTAGSVVGPLLATYALFPLSGLWLGISGVGLAMIAIGEAAMGGPQRKRKRLAARVSILLILGLMTILANPVTLPRVKIERQPPERLLALEEGTHGIVAVFQAPDSRSLVLNNFYRLGGSGSAFEERQQAQIPFFLHPEPRRVALLGLGTGITAGGALFPVVEKLAVLEMVPEVARTAARYFTADNLGVMSDPRVELIHEDARIYLNASGQKFDLVIGDLIVPWRSGESSLFTREHFEATRRALAPGGIFCQWLPMYQLNEEQFRIIAATFLDVFPDTTLWRGDLLPNVPALALIGHASAAPIDAAMVDYRIEQLRPLFAATSPILAARGGIWSFLVGPIHASDPAFARSRRNLESEPWIELLSPLLRRRPESGALAAFTGEELLEFMERTRAGGLAGSVLTNLTPDHLRWRDAGQRLWQASLLLHQGSEEEANRRAAEAIASFPEDLRTAINGR